MFTRIEFFRQERADGKLSAMTAEMRGSQGEWLEGGFFAWKEIAQELGLNCREIEAADGRVINSLTVEQVKKFVVANDAARGGAYRGQRGTKASVKELARLGI